MVGQVIGNYRLVRQLGEGGMGAVYMGEHALLGRRAAIKMLHPSLSMRQDIVTRFFNEARAATAIADPGIVAVFDFGYHTDAATGLTVAFIVMELLEGEPLDVRLAQRPLALVDALRIARQIATSLAAAHAKGIVHRDLKPENIYLVRDAEVAGGERVKILDFGIAKLATTDAMSKTQTGAIMGTPAYMSPEQCRGAGEVDHRTDIYALGCVLYHALTGRPPFIAAGIGEMLAMQMVEAPVPPTTYATWLPRSVDVLVMKCLAKSADARFASMTELASALGNLVTAGAATMIAELPQSAVVGVPGRLASQTPTTLGSATASVNGTAAPRRGRAAVIATVLMLGAAGAAFALWPRGDGAATATAPTAIDAGAPMAATADAAAPIDAGPDAAAPIDAAAAPVDAAVPPDAGRRRHRPDRPEPTGPGPTVTPPTTPSPKCRLDDNGVPLERC